MSQKSEKIHKNLLTLLLSLFVLLCFIQTQRVNCYNLSPKPNIIIKDPQLASVLPKVESSYFGFTLSLRPLGIFVGAPRAQSTLASQRNVNETGAIYRCSLTNTTCYPYVFDSKGNFINELSEYTYDSEKRDNQWLGAAMDGGPLDTDKLVVCAPRFIAPTPVDYLMHGICYWVNDTLSADPTNVRKISPLRLKGEQVKTSQDGVRYYYYMLAEQGLSAHVSDNNEELLIGAPGLHTWKGSVIRYHLETVTVDPTLSRRDVEGRRIPRQADLADATPSPTFYKSDVVNPARWKQPNDSYFGYAVATGYFDSEDRQKLVYLATAPQAQAEAQEQSGEAYIFDIKGDGIINHYVFRGEQFGEYFGYSVLAVDLNNDGLTDVIISAPQHSITGLYDDGVIYVFMNSGRYNFKREKYESPFKGKARFGSTLSNLGDINHDGYNDVAVGAPFADDNGAVFIYLGGPNGLREKPSQRLNSPPTTQSKYGAHMFGHGLSKGSDIDGNGFNDFAIGAPNAETVFIYRAYPVIKVLATINSQTREIKADQPRFQAKVCYGFSTTSRKVQNQPLSMRVVMDPQVKRVKIINSQSNEYALKVTATQQQQCQVLDCEVRYSVADIFKPIELELHYDIVNGVPDSETFCDDCVAIDPAEPKVYTERIIFSTGCATEICIADLEVKSVNLDHSYIMGSSRTLSVRYEVSNHGETAYLPQINITSSNNMPFAKMPSNCKIENDVVLLCDLNRGQPMAKDSKDSILVIYEVRGITGKAMILTAEVFSTGKERNPENNKIHDVITLKEFTQIDAVGAPKTAHINLEKVKDTAEVINFYEIKSNGPSIINELEVTFMIPISYKVPGSTASIPIIDLNNITMQAVYDSQLVNIDYYQNKTQILLNVVEKSTTVSKSYHTSQNGANYDSVKMGSFDEVTRDENLGDTVATASMTRRRREAELHTATKDQYAKLTHAHAYGLLDEDMRDRLAVNRTIVFNCHDPAMVECVRAVMRVYNFQPEKPITVTMKYNVDLKEVNQILIEPWEFFVVLIGLDLHKIGGEVDPTSLAINKRIEYNIISKHQLYGTPIWIIILAVLGGLLILALMTYGLYKGGFFKRAKKEEMDKLVSQNQGGIDGEPETENLNSERD